MKPRRSICPEALIALAACGTALLLAACNTSLEKSGARAPAPLFAPAVSINALMVTWVDNAAHVLWDVEKEGFAPKDEADWIELEDHATQLAAAGSLIRMGGTGQADPGWIQQVGWKENAEAMTTAALAELNAAKSRNLEAVVKANGDLVSSCEGCHKAFKPQVPSEGIIHQRPHSESRRTGR